MDMFSFGPMRGSLATLTEALEAAKLTNPGAEKVIDAAKAALATECASPNITDVRIRLTAQDVTLDKGCGFSGCNATANPCLNHPTTPRLTEASVSETLMVETHAHVEL